MSSIENEDTIPNARSSATPLPSTRVGRYTLCGPIGAGGMGIVHEAYDPELDRLIAIKVMHDETAAPAEAQAMAALSHPNVVSVHDVGEVAGRAFIAMELVRGQTLRDWLEEPRSLDEILGVFEQAGRGLAAAHAAGLVHRDFKPENVMIGMDGRVRVTDFGLAIRHENAPRETATFGTPAYMAPEQLLAQTPDPRSDQFSFCVALHEALYGRRPFDGGSFDELAANVLSGDIPTDGLDRTLRPRLRRVLRRGLSRFPEDRYPSMSALLADLRPRHTRTRRRLTLAIAALLGLLGVASTAFSALSHRPGQFLTEDAGAHEAYFQGRLYLRNNDVGFAQSAFQRAATLDPGFALAHFRIAYTKDYRGQPGARESLDTALRLMDTVPPEQRVRARKEILLMNALDAKLDGRRLRALAVLQQLLQEFPNDDEATFMVGDLLFHGGEPEAAIPYFEAVIERDPAFERAIAHVIYAYVLTGDTEAARRWIDRYLERSPSPSAHHRATEALLAMGDFDEAERVARRGYRLHGRFETLAQDLGAVYLFRGDLQNADRMVREGIRRAPPHYAIRWRMWRDAYIGHYDAVDTGYTELLAVAPNRLTHTRFLAEHAYFRARFLGDVDGGKHLLEEALADDPAAAEDRFVAFYASQVEPAPQSIEVLQAELARSTRFRPVVALDLAAALRAEGRGDEARTLLEETLSRRSFDEFYTYAAPHLLAQLADVQNETGHPAEAAATRARLQELWRDADPVARATLRQ